MIGFITDLWNPLGFAMPEKMIQGMNRGCRFKLEFGSVLLAVPLFGSFTRRLFPCETNRRVLLVVYAVSCLFSVAVFVVPPQFFTNVMATFDLFLVLTFLYWFAAVWKAVLRRRAGARICLFALLIIMITVVHDVLYENRLISGGELAPLGVFLFFFTQTLVVIMNIYKAYEDVERLSGELSEINMRLEEKIRDRTQALELSKKHLMQANEHLNRVENSRRELIVNITHELGTPMTSIQGYMKALLDGVVQPERQYIQIIYDKVQMADRLVQDLFDLTKLEEGQTSFHLVDVVVEELFEDHLSLFRLDVENQGICYRLDKPGSPDDMLAIVRVDPIRIRQVMINLVGNALNYTDEGGIIIVGGEYREDRLVISVSDTGKGIDSDMLPHIFDRFFKGAGPRRNAKGSSGLGLAIAKEIVLRHGGDLSVRSEPGKGSIFSFDIPVEFIPMAVN